MNGAISKKDLMKATIIIGPQLKLINKNLTLANNGYNPFWLNPTSNIYPIFKTKNQVKS